MDQYAFWNGVLSDHTEDLEGQLAVLKAVNDELLKQREAARAWARQLDGYFCCAWCGTIVVGRKALEAHMTTCRRNPVAQRIRDLEEENAKLRKLSEVEDETRCPYCHTVFETDEEGRAHDRVCEKSPQVQRIKALEMLEAYYAAFSH
jgi:hypothetical protein